MMIWINGPFGVGKTTAGKSVVAAQPAFRLFDPEAVGYMLMHSMKDQTFDNFRICPLGGHWSLLQLSKFAGIPDSTWWQYRPCCGRTIGQS